MAGLSKCTAQRLLYQFETSEKKTLTLDVDRDKVAIHLVAAECEMSKQFSVIDFNFFLVCHIIKF